MKKLVVFFVLFMFLFSLKCHFLMANKYDQCQNDYDNCIGNCYDDFTNPAIVINFTDKVENAMLKLKAMNFCINENCAKAYDNCSSENNDNTSKDNEWGCFIVDVQ